MCSCAAHIAVDGFGDSDGVLWAGWGATAVADTGYSGTSGGVVVLGQRVGNMGCYLPVEVSFSVERGRILVVFVVEANWGHGGRRRCGQKVTPKLFASWVDIFLGVPGKRS